MSVPSNKPDSRDDPGSSDRYVGLFNAQSNDAPLDLSKATYRSPVVREVNKEVVISVPLQGARKLVLAVTDGGDGFSYDHAVWIDPILRGPRGTLRLGEDLQWTSATAGWGKAHVNRTCENRPLRVAGQQVRGIGTHALSEIEFDLPEGL